MTAKKQYYKFMEELDNFNAISLDIMHTELGAVITLFYESSGG